MGGGSCGGDGSFLGGRRMDYFSRTEFDEYGSNICRNCGNRHDRAFAGASDQGGGKKAVRMECTR